MNKKIIGVSIAMLFAANAFAQSTNGSSVELYGVLDVAMGTENHSLSIDPNFPASVNPISPTKLAVNNSATGLFNGGISDSRFGIRGTEDLGGGLKAIFTLESGFNLPTGNLNNGALALANNPKGTVGTASANTSLNGQLFSRQAFVGLEDSSLGKITVGRNYASFYDIVVAYDPVQAAQLFSPLGFSGGYGGGAGVSENTRQDNSVKYSNKFGDFNVGAMYKFGGVAGKSSAESGYSFTAGYNADGFGIQAAYQAYTDAIKAGNGAATLGSVNVTNYNTTGYMIAAKYAFGDATIKAGYESFTLKAPSDTLATLGVTNYYGFPISTGSNFAGTDQTTDIAWVGGDYNFTPAFNLGVGFYDISPKASSATTTTPAVAGQLAGNIYAYSLLADYHFTKRTDLYAGLMYSQAKGDQFPSTAYNTSNYIYAVGMRTKF